MNRLWSIIAVLACAFPFVALGFKVFENSALAGVIYAVIVLIFFGSLIIASRLNITLSPSETAAATTGGSRAPAPPISWNWDGVNRQPDEQAQDDEDGTVQY